jgi:hydrogenase/urease accessory protein HupE
LNQRRKLVEVIRADSSRLVSGPRAVFGAILQVNHPNIRPAAVIHPVFLAVALLCVFLVGAPSVQAHSLVFTRVEAMLAEPAAVNITVDYDLGLVLPQRSAYPALTTSSPEVQQAAIARALPDILDALQFYAGSRPLQLKLQGFTMPNLSAAAFQDPAQDKSTVLRFRAALPPDGGPLVLVVPYGARVDHPVLFAIGTPAAGVIARSWVEEGPSEPFDWRTLAPRPPWWEEVARYFRLGLQHIVPDGLDHILFVLALFFLGQTWRKLIAQTTVFTVAHATTLFLSQYGVASLPGRFVEPLIAFSIACIALENIFRPKLGPARLALVFAFGLVHGLGFASSLSEVRFPRDEFVIALLGFNFGVDCGQLVIIGLALLAVGWFRDKPWFRARIMIPCCLAIAGVGLFWTMRRILAG